MPSTAAATLDCAANGTINTADSFGLEREIVRPADAGRRADADPDLLTIVKNLPIETVIPHAGQIEWPKMACESGKCPHYDWAPMPANSSTWANETLARMFQIRRLRGQFRDCPNVIGVVEKPSPDPCATSLELPVTEGSVHPTANVPDSALVNGIAGTGTVVTAAVSCFGYQGPVAMHPTVAHDSRTTYRGGH